MSVGTGTALAIGLGTSAGLGALGAKKQSSAAKQAAQTQSASVQQAMGMQSQMFQQALAAQQAQNARMNAMYQPYSQAAPQSLAALHRFLGVPMQAPAPRAPMGGSPMLPSGMALAPAQGPQPVLGPSNTSSVDPQRVAAIMAQMQGQRPSGMAPLGAVARYGGVRY